MNSAELENILKSKKLSNTESRQLVLATFLNSNSAISQKDIEDNTKSKIDRVTIYRTLNTFVEKGIIHKVLDDSNILKYALCNFDDCNAHNHDDNHVHFKCDICQSTTCIEEINVPQINLPKGYIFKEANLLIKGICKNCQ